MRENLGVFIETVYLNGIMFCLWIENRFYATAKEER